VTCIHLPDRSAASIYHAAQFSGGCTQKARWGSYLARLGATESTANSQEACAAVGSWLAEKCLRDDSPLQQRKFQQTVHTHSERKARTCRRDDGSGCSNGSFTRPRVSSRCTQQATIPSPFLAISPLPARIGASELRYLLRSEAVGLSA
jgi:hypothetical protein